MLSRRQLLATAAATAASASLPLTARAQTPAPFSPTSFVDPLIGTGGHGHTYPGASIPFGMIQLSPDTDNCRWDSCSGYYHDDATLLGFSHTHLSGTGAADMLDLLVVPGIGPARLSPGTLANPAGSYRTPIDHSTEVAVPGYYRLTLPETGITAELTATQRAGLHRYTFPAGADAHLLIDWSHGMRDTATTPTHISGAHLQLLDAHTLVGKRQVSQWAGGRIIHFALRTAQPISAVELYSDDLSVTNVLNRVDGSNLKAVLHFAHLKGPLLIKAGLSAVDIDGALNNVQHDLADFDFETTRQKARTAWDSELSRIRIETTSDTDRKIFYTALYHAHMAPTLFSDADGRYRGMDANVHFVTAGRGNYSTYSLWDTYRALHPLMTLIAPDRAADFASNLIDMGMESPAGPCIWPLQGVETHCMIGWHSAVVIAEALNKGLPGVDARKAWSLYRHLAFERATPGLTAYRAKGYIACDEEDQSVSKTLEYAYDDWAMAHIALAAGALDDAKTLSERSRNYRNIFDAKEQFARPRLTSGDWADPFDARAMGHDSKKWWDFTESNSWQATFLNQHDVYGYIGLFGGDAAYEAKLDGLFNASTDLPPDAPPDMTGLIGQYIHGNEPSHHIAYLYAYCGTHYKTQARVRSLTKSQYRADFDGLAGNEDCGQMSAWYILSAMGFYPVDPVSGVYVFGSPIFSRTEIPLSGGKQLTIIADNSDDDHPYIDSITWNGQPYTKSWIGHADLMGGGELRFVMAAAPNKAFGAAIADRPPSFQPLNV